MLDLLWRIEFPFLIKDQDIENILEQFFFKQMLLNLFGIWGSSWSSEYEKNVGLGIGCWDSFCPGQARQGGRNLILDRGTQANTRYLILQK